MEQPILNQKYKKYKLRVKLWERDFKKKHNRIPSKYDIRDAPKEIRDSYKMYYKLKTSFLEDTLNDVLSEDGFDILETSQGDLEDSLQDICGGPQLPLDVSTISNMECSNSVPEFSNINEQNLPAQLSNAVNLNEHHVIKEFVPVSVTEHNLKAWGHEAVKKQRQKKQISPVKPKVFKSNLNAKLFTGSSFSKRNPRKSLARPSKELSQTSLASSQSETIDSDEVLPDWETILAQRAKELAAKDPSDDLMAAVGFTKPTKGSSLQLDKGWLNRNVGVTDESFSCKKSEESVVPMGLSNINLAEIVAGAKIVERRQENCISPTLQTIVKDVPVLSRLNHDSDSVVSNSEDEHAIQEYRHVAKRRRVLTTIERNQQKPKPVLKVPEQTSPPLSVKLEITLPEKSTNETISDGEEDEIKPIRKTIIKKSKTKAKTKTEPSRPTVKKRTTRVRATKNIQVKDAKTEENEKAETASNPMTIKYSLALESSAITCLPRANVDDLQKANSVASAYINNICVNKVRPSIPVGTESINEKREAARNKLAEKVSSGKLNENFVRINIQKKVFVRGKKNGSFSTYKKKLWKQKKASALTGAEMDMGGCDGGVLTCFQCGQPGHFAKDCKLKSDSLLPMSVELDDDSPFLTLEEAEQLASQSALAVHSSNLKKLPEATNFLLYKDEEPIEHIEELPDNTTEVAPPLTYIGHKIPEDFLEKAGLLDSAAVVSESGPIYDLNPDGSVLPPTEEVYEALQMFGHANFRKGQDRAIMRILSGQSTLVTLSTGSGKSLCYQLPAYLYSKKKHSITLVISPLVSLMEDQVHGVPHFLRAHCLHTNQTPQQRIKILEKISNCEIDILLISPEAVVAGERSTGFGSILRNLPPIAFACIDEAHCVSQWSHNFRPSYLMICKVLQKNLGVKTVLGLTATATLPTRECIIRQLGIPDGEKGIISDVPLPDNLIISVSKDENRNAALIELLTSPRFDLCQSIIIYCTRRDECERVAGHIRTYMQDKKSDTKQNGSKKRKRVNWYAEAYHAGLPASLRRTIQNAFMKNELRIVVATIAFGMGINKPDIRSVIHYNMPRNFESYVQEIGRAGRDGQIAHCHLFLDSKSGDQNELRRHIFANSIDRHVIRKLLQKIFIPCSCDKNLKKDKFVEQHLEEIKASQDIDWDEDIFTEGNVELQKENKRVKKRVCPGHEIGFSIEHTVMSLDIPEENISTLLCYLELDCRWGINVLSSAYIMCKVISYGGSKYLKHAAKNCPPLAMAIAMKLQNKTFDEGSNVIEFSVIDIAAAIGWNSGVVKYQLKNLEWVNENGYPKRSPLSVQYFDLGFRIKAPGDFNLEEIDEALDTLYERSVTQERTQLIQLQYVFHGLSSVAYGSYKPCTADDYPHDRSDKLKSIIRDYFKNDHPKDLVLEQENFDTTDEEIEGDVYSIIQMYPDNNFSGRNIARIFHGIQSPNYPAVIWGRCKYWRAHFKTGFNRIVQLANSVIIKMRT